MILGLTHLAASGSGSCRIWDLHSPEEEQGEDGCGGRVKFSKDGDFLAVAGSASLEMWKVSTWERLWSASCEADEIDFSLDGAQVLVKVSGKINAYNVRSGHALGNEIDCMPGSVHDHVHFNTEGEQEEWTCSECDSSRLNNGEYWFTASDRWLWIVEAHVARRLIHFPVEYAIRHLGGHSGCVAVGCSDRLVVLDTSCI